nr:hypothetical protein [Tanacetum cinerariifolium]
MVTFEGIRANPKKTKEIADMQSPRTLKEMQSLSGKLSALKRFLSRSAERSNQLKVLLKKSTDVFAWEPADITRIPRRIIEHTLNVNPSIEPVAQKRRVLASDRTQVISRKWKNGVLRATLKAISCKVTKHKKVGIEYQHVFVPFAFDAFGFLAPEVVELLNRVQRVMHVRSLSPYNVIFGRTCLRSLRAVSSTIHSMVKFPTPRGIATLVTRPAINFECRSLERKQRVEQEDNQNANQEKKAPKRVDLIEQTLVNPADTKKDHRVQLECQTFDRTCRVKKKGSGIRQNPDTYKGYHQVQMAPDDEEKTAFYRNEGTYCYTKMPFGLKNARATYQRLKALIEDIAETFDNLRRINMKLNPKKCLFGVEEEKFLGNAEPKWKAIGIKKIIVPVCRKSLPFFETLKDITKENKDEYRWTKSAEKAFQEMKKVIVELPFLTTPIKEETLYVYVVAATEAVSTVLLAERKGKQCPIRYVNRTLNEAKRNYAPLEKLAMLLLHMSRRLREYEALLVRLRMTKKMKVQNIDVKINSKLVASQINRSYVESSASMIKYLATAKECIAEFITFVIQNIPRNLNQKAGILSKLTTHAFHHLTKKVLVEVLAERSTDRKGVGLSWKKKKKTERLLSYVVWLKANYVIREIHMRSCGIHIRARSMVAKAIRKGYYWPTMHRDARNMTQKRDSCQVHAQVPRRPKTLMTSIMVPWLFYQWGMDILGPLPQEARKSEFVIVAIDYFTKWIEAKPLARITRKDVKKFVWDNIVCRFGLPHVIVTENETQFINDPFKGWEDENEDELRLNMDLLQERREVATIREAKYKTKMEQYYNQKVRPMSFKPDEYVFQRNEASRAEDQGKLGLKWEGPYRVTEAYQNGSYKLQMMRGKEGILFDVCRRVGISTKKEAHVNVLIDSLDERSTLRPADILICRWAKGKHACIDLTGVSSLVGLSN